PAVEVLVAAAHGEVRAGRGDVHRHGAGAVREVPHRERTDGVGGGGDPGEVRDAGGPEVDVGHAHHGDVLVEGRRDVRRGDLMHREAAVGGDPGGDVPVGGEVAAHGHDAPPPGNQRHRGVQRLVQVHGG